MPKVFHYREDVALQLDPDEPGPRDWPNCKSKLYLGSLGGGGELWLIDGKLIAVWREREK